MKRSRFTEEQIIGMLKEQDAGMTTADVCRKHGVSTATFYKYKARVGGLEVSDARRRAACEGWLGARAGHVPSGRACSSHRLDTGLLSRQPVLLDAHSVSSRHPDELAGTAPARPVERVDAPEV